MRITKHEQERRIQQNLSAWAWRKWAGMPEAKRSAVKRLMRRGHNFASAVAKVER